MGLSASQGRLLLLTAKRSDLEFRAQQISQKRLILSQQLEQISMAYEEATSNRQMSIVLYEQDSVTGEQIRTSSNLTYSALISHTVGISGVDADESGIQASDRVGTKYRTASANTSYRLVGINGEIVVADASEIPLNRHTIKKSEVGAKPIEGYTNVYKPTLTTIIEKSAGVTEKEEPKDLGIYIVAPSTTTDGKTEKSDLAKALEGGTQKSVEADLEDGYVKVGDKYYKISDGKELTEDEIGALSFDPEEAILVDKYNNVPKNTTNIQTPDIGELVEGSDGVYTLYSQSGEELGRYIIDPGLRYGSTDCNGSMDGPNYLQDCLRNGKYLIQKGVSDKNIEGGFRWSHVSWDATTDISDSYYTEDDDTAKAKYDRLQNEIQMQDKKLELELDNIETQRSAVTTEIESVEKVINENVESTFNAFG